MLAANGVETIIQRDDGVHADAGHLARDPRAGTAAAATHLADGIVITPSHNPPEDGGFKYNPPNGGPADTDVTRWIQDRANELLAAEQRRRQARVAAPTAHEGGDDAQEDLVAPYVDDLARSSTWRRSGRPA